MACVDPSATRMFSLYTYYVSSCATRVRIALHLKKKTPSTPHYYGMAEDDHSLELSVAVNSSDGVPALIMEDSFNNTKITLTQSIHVVQCPE